MEQKIDERRKFKRVKYPCFIKVQNNDHNDPVLLLAHIENLSIGGVCIILNKNLAINTIIYLEVESMDEDWNIKCKGKIAWVEQHPKDDSIKFALYNIGIEFIDLSEDIRDQFEKIVERRKE